MKKSAFYLLVLTAGLMQCTQNNSKESMKASNPLLDNYVDFTLTADLSQLTPNDREMIQHAIEAAKIMDEVFWMQAFGAKSEALKLTNDPDLKKYIEINYGPWDRLSGNNPFIEGVANKPLGAKFYPSDMTKEEFEIADIEDKTSQYTMIDRDENGKLISVPYSQYFATQHQKASALLMKCAALASDDGLKKYLTLRAQALLDDNYQPSDYAWMEMKNNVIDIVIGPIENYEDALFNYKAAHEAYVLIKDLEWSERLAKYASMLPDLQKGLPVSQAYKNEAPGTDADLNAYDVVYYAGDCNAGSKTIAINLPNDEEVQLAKGSRRLQLKNAMKAKYEKILIPIASSLLVEDQLAYVNFDAFFANTMFHEVAHGLGIKNTINNQGTVRNALKEHYSALEEGKADVLGLYMITQLIENGELDGDIKNYYTTFMAGIFRSVRFGASSAHGKANMIRFNFFKKMGAFTKDESTGKYRVNYEQMKAAMNALSETILTLQGNGDYEGVAKLVKEMGIIDENLQSDLDKLKSENIPVDVLFNQGTSVLGLE